MLPATFLKRFINARPLLTLYIGGLSATLIYVGCLLWTPEGREIFNAPYGFYDGQYWVNTDAINYVRPARYFITDGAFLDHLGGTLTPGHWHVCSPQEAGIPCDQFETQLIPTYHREIGYPLIIAGFMKIFGPAWDLVLSAFNILAFAFIYPVLLLTAKLIFPARWPTSFSLWPFLFLLISGTYVMQVPFYLADMTLTLLFVVGIYYGLKSLVSLRWNDLILHVAFLGFAAVVKPILAYFAVVDAIILISFARYRDTLSHSRARIFILISVCGVLLASQINSYRNFINNKSFIPSDVLATNMFCLFSKKISEVAGNKELYATGIKGLYEIDSRNIQYINQQKLALAKEIILSHPLIAGSVAVRNAMSVLYRSHFHLFGRSLVREPFSWPVWIVLFPLNYVLYAFAYGAFLLFCLRLIKRNEILMLLALIVFIGYMLGPTFTAEGSRMRLPVEGFIVMFAFAEVFCRTHRK